MKEVKVIEISGTKFVVITLKGLLESYEFCLKEKYRKDLHTLLNYNGQIILALHINDKDCIRCLKNLDKLIEIIHTLNPNILTGLDAHMHYDMPIYLAMIRLTEIYTANRMLAVLNIPMIPYYFYLSRNLALFQYAYLLSSKPPIIGLAPSFTKKSKNLSLLRKR